MPLPRLVTTFDPTPELLAPIRAGLRAFNEAAIGPNPKRLLAVRAESEGTVVGGAFGWLQIGWLYTEWLWVADVWRSQRLGSALLDEMEGQARAAGIHRARLNTGSFQALGFYQKRGYVIFAELPFNGLDGRTYTDYFLRKDL